MGTFSATVSRWTGATVQAMEAVQKGSAQEVAERMATPVAKGGRMRVDTGYLRSSLMASTASMPVINPTARPPSDTPPGAFRYDATGVTAAIIGADLGQTIYLGFTASYAQYRENKDGFVETTALSWPAIVDAETVKAKAAFGV